ncbi:phosphotransferase family protein [Microbacterium sp. GXF6406]
MSTDPEVVRTAAEAARQERPPLLVLDALVERLTAAGLGDATGGGVGSRATRIGEGLSNVTFLLEWGGRRLVLRRGPRPPHPPSTHDMRREARVQRLLAAEGVAVPEILHVCDDESVLGVPFYVMEHLDGDVITDRMPAHLDDEEGRQAMPYAAVDALAALPEVDALAVWLGENLPRSPRASVVHGDFRIGNLMFARSGPARVQAILDWEMATLGDPLADLGYLVATYADRDAAPTPLDLTTVTRGVGYASRADLVDRYVARTGADVSALAWYETLALWKAAVFCEAIHTRWLDGERPGDEFGPALEQGVPDLLAAARAASAAG